LFADVFEHAGFRVHISPNIDAWLKTHAAFISPAADALLLAGGDNYRLAHTRDGLVLMIRALRETFAALRALRIPVTPPPLAWLARLPEPILVLLFSRLLDTHAAEIAMARHARAGRDEMQTLAAEVRTLVKQSGVPSPNLDRLSVYLDAATPPMPEGSHDLRLNWTSIVGGVVMLAGLVLVPTFRAVRHQPQPKHRHA
jgi:2-dehydropantoate 2-reductase